MKARITILICTINDRIRHVASCLLPQRDDLCYVVSFQYTDEMFLGLVPSTLTMRSDVRLLPWSAVGLSGNRNHALRHCRTEFAIFADDDLRYTNESIDRVLRCFDENPEVDVACFRVCTQLSKDLKTYPSYAFDYVSRPKGYYFSTSEIACRMSAKLPQFDVRFGLGSPYLSAGEEELFLHQAWRYGAVVRYFPYYLCTIPNAETTGQRFATEVRMRRSKGAVLCMMHGAVGALLRCTKYAFLLRGSLKFRYKAWCDMLHGCWYVLSHPLNANAAEDFHLDFEPLDADKIK